MHKGATFLKIFPGGGRFARLKADDGIADAQRFARLHGQVAGQAVAFVEQADHGHAFAHRRAGQGGIFARPDLAAFDLYRAGLIGGRDVTTLAGGKG